LINSHDSQDSVLKGLKEMSYTRQNSDADRRSNDSSQLINSHRLAAAQANQKRGHTIEPEFYVASRAKGVGVSPL